MIKKVTALLFIILLYSFSLKAQEEDPYISIDIPSQNLLKFNRFLINPTFSTVNEDKSYVNFYHRNQWIQYDNTNQTYLASYSGRVGDRTGLGLSLYHQKFGTISNFGVMANYAYGIKLAEKSNFTFGFNLSYYNSGYDANEANPGDISDPRLAALEGNSLLSFQPGFNFSIGSFDVGLYAENLFDYNIKTSKSLTDFSEKTFTGHLMYTKKFENGEGIMKNGKMSALARGRKRADDDFGLSGSLILDLPKIGWVQGGYDDYYGIAAGIGFNLTQRLSIGYTIEKGIKDQISNFGPTHEFSFAYSFIPILTEDRVMIDEGIDEKWALSEDDSNKTKEQIIAEKDAEIATLTKRVNDNDMIIEEMMFVQDSMAAARNKDIDRKFAYLLKFIKDNQQKGNNANYEEKVAQLAKELGKEVDTRSIASNNAVTSDNKAKTQPKTVEEKAIVHTATKNAPKTNHSDNLVANEEFESAAKENKVRTKSAKNLEGVQGGFYIIANVYPETKTGNHYLGKFVEKLDEDGLNPDYFKNPKNDLKYVYLKRFDTWQEAMDSYRSDVSGTYTADKWIFNVQNEDGLDFAASNVASPSQKEDNTPSKSKTTIQPEHAEKPTVATKNDESTGTAAGYHEEMSRLYGKDRKAPKVRSAANIAHVNDGYYLIANVFSKPDNADRFVETLKKQGLEADFFINPKNNYRYVYLTKCDTWKNALNSYYSNINNTYHEDVWIMPINKKQI